MVCICKLYSYKSTQHSRNQAHVEQTQSDLITCSQDGVNCGHTELKSGSARKHYYYVTNGT